MRACGWVGVSGPRGRGAGAGGRRAHAHEEQRRGDPWARGGPHTRVNPASDAPHPMHTAPRAHMSKGGKLASYKGGDIEPAATMLETPCDVLIPAAIGGVITGAWGLRRPCPSSACPGAL